MDVRDEALHVNKAVEPENQSLNVSRFYKKKSLDGCRTEVLYY